MVPETDDDIAALEAVLAGTYESGYDTGPEHYGDAMHWTTQDDIDEQAAKGGVHAQPFRCPMGKCLEIGR